MTVCDLTFDIEPSSLIMAMIACSVGVEEFVSVVGLFCLFLSAMPCISWLQSFLCFIEFNCFATVFQSLVHLNRISSAKSKSVPWEPPQPLLRFPVHILKD